MRPVRFEFKPKTERVNMRLSRQLLEAVRAAAAKAGVPYQRFIRQALGGCPATQARVNLVNSKYASMRGAAGGRAAPQE